MADGVLKQDKPKKKVYDKRIKERRDRWDRVAPKRFKKILDALDSLGKCANVYNYGYKIPEVNEMFNKIKERVDKVFYDFALGNVPFEEPEELKPKSKKRT